MSDAVMKPMADSVSGREIFSACQEILAASTPVGGWEGAEREEALALLRTINRECDIGRHEADVLSIIDRLAAPPPPSVSIDNGSRPQEAVSTEQADGAVLAQLVDRFLSWKLPETFNPDGGVRFDKENLHPAHWPSGTNLLDYTQATEMVRHMLAGKA